MAQAVTKGAKTVAGHVVRRLGAIASQVSLDRVADVIVTPVSGGVQNYNRLVKLVDVAGEEQSFFVSGLRPEVGMEDGSAARTEATMRFLKHLSDKEVRCTEPCAAGGFAGEAEPAFLQHVPQDPEIDAVFGEGFSGRDVAVYRWLNASMAKETADDAHQAGRWLASMHQASADFDVPDVLKESPLALLQLKNRYTDILGFPSASGHCAHVFLERAAAGGDEAIEAAIGNVREHAVMRGAVMHPNAHYVAVLPKRIDDGIFQELARELFAIEQSKARYARLPKGMCHGDFHAGNGMVDNETGEYIGIDYDWLAEGECATDLARAAFFWAAKPEGVDREILEGMMDGYQSVRELETIERVAMPSLMEAAAVRFELRRLANITSAPVAEVKKSPGEFVPDRLAAYRASRGEEMLKEMVGVSFRVPSSALPSLDTGRV